MDDHFGDVLWSDYFDSRIVVVRFVDDGEWYFVVEANPTVILRAQAKLSELRADR